MVYTKALIWAGFIAIIYDLVFIYYFPYTLISDITVLHKTHNNIFISTSADC